MRGRVVALTCALTLAAGSPGPGTEAAPAPSAGAAVDGVVPGAPPAPAADTTLPARRGDRLVVQNFSGRILVGAGDDDVVELLGESGDRVDLRLLRRGDRISVEPSERRRGDRELDAVLRVPRWMDVELRGRDLEVEIRAVAGRVAVRNVEGDILLEDTGGPVEASTVDGVIRARGARGNLALLSRGDDVRVEDVVAQVVEVESGDGDLTLRDVDALRLRAETLDGDVLLDGPVRPDGSYEISVHDGDARVLLPRGAGVRVAVSTFDGEFVAEFPVRVERYNAGRTFEFTLGDGRARLDIKVFDGEIRLGERPGRS